LRRWLPGPLQPRACVAELRGADHSECGDDGLAWRTGYRPEWSRSAGRVAGCKRRTCYGLSLTYRSPDACGFLPMFEEMQARLEERRAERKRIAQDLHDTVLQEFLGASLHLQVAVDQLPANSPVKLRLNRVVELMGRVVKSVRLAVCGLRSSSTEVVDLAEAFARIPKELGTEDQIEFRVLVLGSPKRLNPVVWDEVYRIGHEASERTSPLPSHPHRGRTSVHRYALSARRPRRRLRHRSRSTALGARWTLGIGRVCANGWSESEHG
jgi:hypothetical protein